MFNSLLKKFSSANSPNAVIGLNSAVYVSLHRKINSARMVWRVISNNSCPEEFIAPRSHLQKKSIGSPLVLEFRATAFGSEIHIAHINVPDYEVFIEQTGEKDALGNIINTHWGLQYWEPMQEYLVVTNRTLFSES